MTVMPIRRGVAIILIMCLINQALRQWSLTKLMNYGFDPNTGIWGRDARVTVRML